MEWLTPEYLLGALREAAEKVGDTITEEEAAALFAMQYNMFFPENRGGRVVRRGGIPYLLPGGWHRFPLALGKKYGDDNAWLGNGDAKEEWAVAFHGTGLGYVVQILRDGFKAGKGQGAEQAIDTRSGLKIGQGVFVTPNIQVAQAFANGYRKSRHKNTVAYEYQGHAVYAVLQCRVRPDAIKRPNRCSAVCNDEEVMGLEGTFEWILNKGDDVRPYALLIKEASRGDPRSGDLLGDRTGAVWHKEHKPLAQLYHPSPTPAMLASQMYAVMMYHRLGHLGSEDVQAVTLGPGHWQYRFANDANQASWSDLGEYFTASADYVVLSGADTGLVPWNGKFVDLCVKTLVIKQSREVVVRRVDDKEVVIPLGKLSSKLEGEDPLTHKFMIEAFCKAVAKDGGRMSIAEAEKLFRADKGRDFRNWNERVYRRGGVLYKPPVGWRRFGLDVEGKYDDGNDAWMGMDGEPGEWAVAYHGTGFGTVPKIMTNGFKVGSGQGATNCFDTRTGKLVGNGVFVTPNITVGECYANGQEDGGSEQMDPAVVMGNYTFYFAFQCRVRPWAICRPSRHFALCNDEEVMGIDGVFEWVVNDPADIRPYGVLVRIKENAPHQPLGQLIGRQNWHKHHKPAPTADYWAKKVPGQQAPRPHIDRSHHFACFVYAQNGFWGDDIPAPKTFGGGHWQIDWGKGNLEDWIDLPVYFTAAADRLVHTEPYGKVCVAGEMVSMKRATLTVKIGSVIRAVRRLGARKQQLLPEPSKQVGTCLAKHPMQLYAEKPGRGPNHICDKCDGDIPNIVPMFRCIPCDFDLCEKCFGIGDPGQEGVCCPSNHTLHSCTKLPGDGDNTCDKCSSNIPNGEPMMRCMRCDFDLCASCFAAASPRKKRIRLKTGDKVQLTNDHAKYQGASDGPLGPGDVGVMLKDNGSGTHFLIAAKAKQWWYDERALKKVQANQEQIVRYQLAAKCSWPSAAPHATARCSPATSLSW